MLPVAPVGSRRGFDKVPSRPSQASGVASFFPYSYRHFPHVSDKKHATIDKFYMFGSNIVPLSTTSTCQPGAPCMGRCNHCNQEGHRKPECPEFDNIMNARRAAGMEGTGKGNGKGYTGGRYNGNRIGGNRLFGDFGKVGVMNRSKTVVSTDFIVLFFYMKLICRLGLD